MAIPIKIIEDFFGAKFHFEQRLAELTHFDGYAYWHICWMPDDGQFLKIAASKVSLMPAYPIVEMEGRFTDNITVAPLSGGGDVMILHPEGTDDSRNWVTITRTKHGEFSLSFSTGVTDVAS